MPDDFAHPAINMDGMFWERERGENINSGNYILPAMPNGIALTPLEPRSGSSLWLGHLSGSYLWLGYHPGSCLWYDKQKLQNYREFKIFGQVSNYNNYELQNYSMHAQGVPFFLKFVKPFCPKNMSFHTMKCLVSRIFRVFLHHLKFPTRLPKIQRIFKIYKGKIFEMFF